MLTLQRTRLTCKCSSSKKEPKAIFKEFHKKRTDTIKQNANHIVAISQKDLAEVNSFLKELDELHKAQFDGLKDIIKKHRESKNKSDASASTVDPEVVVEGTITINNDSDNIFMKKN